VSPRRIVDRPGDTRHDRLLARGQPRPTVDVGIGAELLDEIDGDLEALLALGDLQILRPDADGDRLTGDLVPLLRGQFELDIAEAQRRLPRPAPR
jgi:hypothetical protein